MREDQQQRQKLVIQPPQSKKLKKSNKFPKTCMGTQTVCPYLFGWYIFACHFLLVWGIEPKGKNMETSATAFEGNRQFVKPEWIDYNGHMNVAYYMMAFDLALDDILDHVGFHRDYKKRKNITTFVGDFHIHYRRELREGDPLRITQQLVGLDRKRIHICQSMYHADEHYLAAQSEIMQLHIDQANRRVSPMDDESFAMFTSLYHAHRHLDKPEQLGRMIKQLPPPEPLPT